MLDARVGSIVVKRVLMIAYHYPPVYGSSGMQRTLTFSRYLPQHGWQPIILTVHPRAYQAVNDGQLRDIPESVVIKRAFALDTAKHLAFRGAYPGFLAVPDRWVSWWLGAVPAGMALIRRYRPNVIWSTYPIASAHLIGLTLQRLSGLPWIADFRDSMTEEEYPTDPLTRRAYRWIERRTIARCRHAVFTTPGAARMYAARYPEAPAARWAKIENGYDEENFRALERGAPVRQRTGGKIVLLHSGLLYPSERDPRAFFAALEELNRAGEISEANLKIVLRASGNEAYYHELVRAHGLHGIVFLEPAISYREALEEMMNVDGLLIFQAANCNHQIPAKVYEYLRARRPVFALTDPVGDTALLLAEAGIDTLSPLDSKAAIMKGLRDFLERLRQGRAPLANDTIIASYTREARTKELAKLLDALA